MTAILVIPWTLKFAWAPLVDALTSDQWTFRNWILAAQSVMVLTILPLFWIQPLTDFHWLTGCLLVHAISAATQDVAIDGLCIAETDVHQRGQYNGWMQAGMLLGCACLGGGSLVLLQYVDQSLVVALLIACIALPAMLIYLSEPRAPMSQFGSRRLWEVLRACRAAMQQRNTWLGLLFGLTGAAAFKSLEVVYGPFLIDRGCTEASVGWFSAGPMIGAMVIGSVLGGWLADRVRRIACVAISLIAIVACIATMAMLDVWFEGVLGRFHWICLTCIALGIGVFTSAAYAMYMDLTDPKIAATQFSAFMGSTNGCESWSTYAVGRIVPPFGYPIGFLAMCIVSIISLLILWRMRPTANSRRLTH